MTTEREEFNVFNSWYMQTPNLSPYAAWQAATIAERERCIKAMEEVINENCGDEPNHEGVILISLGVIVERRIRGE